MLVYTEKITNRVKYIFKILLTDLLGQEIEFTDQKEYFISTVKPKLNYSKVRFRNEVYICSSNLLFEDNISNQLINVSQWNNHPIFFQTTGADLPFDIFAASFYLIVRYEEYLPFNPDIYGRFEASNSLAFQHNFIEDPIINSWTDELKKIIFLQYPELKNKVHKFKNLVTIDIDSTFAIKHKGFFRTTGKLLESLLRTQFKDLFFRLKVILNIENDPYDMFDYFYSLFMAADEKPILFWLVGDYGKYDKNISIHHPASKIIIYHSLSYSETGLHPSFKSGQSLQRILKEKKRLEQVVNKKISKSRQHFLKIKIPDTYQNLIKCGIEEDYSLGYASHSGFRAGICHPFHFFDLTANQETNLTIYPLCLMDRSLISYMKLTSDESSFKIKELMEKVRKYNGIFISLWHNETIAFSDDGRNWRNIFEQIIREK